MFKKLTLVALSITSSYAVENNKIPLDGNSIVNNITQNNITQQMSSITQSNTEKEVNDTDSTIPTIFQDNKKAFLYSDSGNVDTINNTTNKSQSNKKNEKPFRNFVNKLFVKYPNNNKPGEKLFDIEHLASARTFRHMSDEEKDWARFRAYNQFAETCQSFMQMAILKKEVSQKLRRVLYLTHSLRNCVITGLDPQQIFLDELKFNINSECYTKHLPHLQQQFDLVISHLKLIREQFRKYFIEHGIVEEK